MDMCNVKKLRVLVVTNEGVSREIEILESYFKRYGLMAIVYGPYGFKYGEIKYLKGLGYVE